MGNQDTCSVTAALQFCLTQCSLCGCACKDICSSHGGTVILHSLATKCATRCLLHLTSSVLSAIQSDCLSPNMSSLSCENLHIAIYILLVPPCNRGWLLFCEILYRYSKDQQELLIKKYRTGSPYIGRKRNQLLLPSMWADPKTIPPIL